MDVFQKVLNTIKGGHLNGHALRNIQNKRTLTLANDEIKEMLKNSNTNKH